MEFDAIGKDSPHIQLDGAEVFIFTSANGSADVAEVHRVMNNFGVQRHQLK